MRRGGVFTYPYRTAVPQFFLAKSYFFVTYKGLQKFKIVDKPHLGEKYVEGNFEREAREIWICFLTVIQILKDHHITIIYVFTAMRWLTNSQIFLQTVQYSQVRVMLRTYTYKVFKALTLSRFGSFRALQIFVGFERFKPYNSEICWWQFLNVKKIIWTTWNTFW